MIKVALSGGIGSGKSTVALVFEMMGVPIYYSDQRARGLMNGVLREQIVGLFGERAYIGSELNNRYISSLVFSDRELLGQLNGIVHPAVVSDFLSWAETQHSPFVMIETALLLESGIDRIVDSIVAVTAPKELRIERVVKRDGISREAVCARIKAQTSQEQIISMADAIIDTKPKKMVLPQIVKFVESISEKE
ncbi:MAG: dephospho-CoA kinase [Rikenellaceae bacterium]